MQIPTEYMYTCQKVNMSSLNWSSEVRTARSRERVCERPGHVYVSFDKQWKVALLWMLASCVQLFVRQCQWKQVNSHRSEPPEGTDARPSTCFLR